LIVVLGATMAVGAGAYLHNRHKSKEDLSLKAIDPAVLDAKSEPRTSTVDAPLPPTALVTQTPGDVAAISGSPPATATAPTPPPTVAPTPVLAALTISPHVIDDARAKIDAGDLLSARHLLNDAILSGQLSEADADVTRHSLTEINQTVIFSRKQFKDDTFQTVYQVQAGERLARIADKHGVTWELLCRINGLADARKVRAGQWIKIPSGPFHCVVTKSAYRLDVYLGSPGESTSLFVATFPVGLGKDNSTPTGSWVIQQGGKAHPATYYSPRGEGVIAADDPKNPLGGYWMGLTGVAGNAVEKNSYGIHGTIDPDSIGKQASMGCIRLGHEDIALLYDLMVDGKSKVVVKD
jgi:lipoprotein-anchoring transpeptidase ErfK/SrfK